MYRHLLMVSAGPTDYNRAHATAYLQLQDAVGVGANSRDATDTVFAIDSAKEETLARQIFDANRARARWMTSVGHQ